MKRSIIYTPIPKHLELNSGPRVSFCWPFELGISNPGGCGDSYLLRGGSKDYSRVEGEAEKRVQVASGRDKAKEGICWCWITLCFLVPSYFLTLSALMDCMSISVTLQ